MAREVVFYHSDGWLTHRFLWKFKGGIKLHTKLWKARLFVTQDNFDSSTRLSAMIALIYWRVHGQGNHFIPLELVIDASFSLKIQRRHKTWHKISEISLICNTEQLWQQDTAFSHESSDSQDSLWPGKSFSTTGMGDSRIVFSGNSKAA